MPETENFGAKRLKHFVGQDSWTLFELLLGKEPAFLTMRVQRLSTEETYLSLKKVVVPMRVVNECAERSQGLVTDYYIDKITGSEEQKFHLYQVVKDKEICEKGLSKKLVKQMNYLFQTVNLTEGVLISC